MGPSRSPYSEGLPLISVTHGLRSTGKVFLAIRDDSAKLSSSGNGDGVDYLNNRRGTVASSSQGIEDLTQFAMEVIRRSGAEALSYYGRGKHNIRFDEDLVTEVELHLAELFQDQLHARFSDHLVFDNTEQNRDYTHEGKRYLWVYDPLDGLANFQAGIPIWGISLALLENFWPILGVFYMPVTGDLFHAQAGQNAFLGKEQIRVSDHEDINDESILLTYSRFHHHYHSTFPGKIRDLGSTVAHICYVAMGLAEAALVAKGSYRDLAAARVIIEAAGGKIYKMDGTEFFLNEYLDGQRVHDHLLILTPGTYAQVRNYLREIY
jgi:myo-inositol-1(or 4)-monophosphatase